MPYVVPPTVPASVSMSAGELRSTAALTLGTLAVMFAVVGLAAGNSVVLLFAVVSTVLSSLLLQTGSRARTAPAQDQAG